MLDILLDALIDTLKTLPFLFGAYLLIEFLEHRASEKLTGALRRLGPFGPVGGAVLGLVFGTLAMGLVILRFLMDDTIKTEEDVVKYLNLNTLAALPVDRKADPAGGKKKKKTKKG